METGFLYLIDIFGTFAFAVSGAYFAMEKKLDAFGVLIIAFVTAIGGGTLRDLIIGNLPVGWLKNETIILVIFTAAIGTMLFDRVIIRFNRTLFLFDALGLGLFTMVGIEKGIALNLSAGICIALGTITASFGGVLRDVLLNQVPLIFRKEIYALACIAGGVMYFLMVQLTVQSEIAKILCILIIVAIRVIAVRYQLSLPRFKPNN